MDKIKVCYSTDELKSFLNEHKNLKICLYLAQKSNEAWDISTSRVYMNKIDKNFIYLPVNIMKDDYASLREVYNIAQNIDSIVAINQTQPHKSNPVLRELFSKENIPQNVDSLIKDKNNKLQCYNLNGSSFLSWFEDEVETFEGKVVVVFGVGGVGEPIARIIADKKLLKMYLVDINSKEELENELSKKTDVKYFDNLGKVNFNKEDKLIFINCAGKEGLNDNEVINVIKNFKNLNNIFVDLRPQLEIEIVNSAKQFGWNSYTGYGMNSRNDYVLLQKISEISGINIPSFDEFKKLVKEAS